MHATRCLREEHQLILKVLNSFEVVLARSDESGTISREEFEPFVEFFRGYADRCHHCKEEDRLFPCMEACGVVRDGGPIGVMLTEHQQCRMHIRTIAEHLDDADAGDTVARELVMEHGLMFHGLLTGHINKEDAFLFTMADQLIQNDDLATLALSYDQAEAEPGYDETITTCRRIARRLIERYDKP